MSMMKNKLLMAAVCGFMGAAVQQGEGSDLGTDGDRLYADVKQLHANSWPAINRELNKSADDLTRLPQDLLMRMAAIGAGMGDLSMKAEMVRMTYGSPNWVGVGDRWLSEVLASNDVAIIESLQRFFADKYSEPVIRTHIARRLKELEPPPPPPSSAEQPPVEQPSAEQPPVKQLSVEQATPSPSPVVVQAGENKPDASDDAIVGVLRAEWIEDVVTSRMEFIYSRKASVKSLSKTYDDSIIDLSTNERKSRQQLLREIKADIDSYSPRALKLLSVGIHPTQPLMEMDIAYVYKAAARRSSRSGVGDRSGYLKILFLINDRGKVTGMKTIDSGTTKPEPSSGFIPYAYDGELTVLEE